MQDYSTPPAEISQVSDLDLSATYSYAHYLKWTFDERMELIKGKVFTMSPGPARMHQKISREISFVLHSFLKNKKCEVYTAPFDVRFPKKSLADEDIFTVVQPDLCVICDKHKLDERGCIGAPDIVVEILSPGNNKKELKNKFEVYEESGVKEYWIVSPENQTLLQNVRNEAGKFQASRLQTLGDTVTTPILPGFALNLDEVFAE